LVSVTTEVASGTYQFNVSGTDSSSGLSDQFTLTAHVSQQAAVSLLVASDSLAVSTRAQSTFTATVVNDGNEPDSISMSLTGTTGFEVDISPMQLTLNAGESGEVTVSLRRAGSTEQATMTLTATSQSDAEVSDSFQITATIPAVGVRVTLASTSSSVDASGVATTTMFIENLGEAEDTFVISVEEDFSCDNQGTVILAAGSGATAFGLSCTAANGLLAGTHYLNITAVSLADASESSTASATIDVNPERQSNGDPILTVTITGEVWTMPWNASVTYGVHVQNNGNEEVRGFLFMSGEYADELNAYWAFIEDGVPSQGYALDPGESSSYMLTLRPSGNKDVGTVEVVVQATGTLDDGHSYQINSEPMILTVEHEPPPPTTVALWDGGPEVSNSALLWILLAGWMLSALLVAAIRFITRKSGKDSARDAWDSASEVEEEASILAEERSRGEIRPMEDGTARCHSCEARIMLPADKEPPYRFKCPTCEEMNRVIPAEGEDESD